MQLTIVGAGAVGLTLAARLSLGGNPVRVLSRRRAAAEAIARHGIRLEDPATGAVAEARVAAAGTLDAAAGAAGSGPVIVCVRAGDTEAVALRLAASAPDAVVISAQNDVDNEAVLARHFADVLGLVVRQTCTLRDETHVLATGSGRLVVGRHPVGVDEPVQAVARLLEHAGFDVGRSPRIGRDKWLKLCVNGTSAVNALVRRADHRGDAFVTLKIRLFDEARAALAAAGIEARSCDGRDRSLEQEIEALQASRADGSGLRALPLYNACWAALRDPTRPLEADAYHRRIVDLAARHGTRAPTHAVLLEAVLDAYTTRRGPECLGADALLARATASAHDGGAGR